MTSAPILAGLLNGPESLPGDLKKNFELVRKIDKTAQGLMQQIEANTKDLMKEASEEVREEKLKLIQELFAELKKIGTEKEKLVTETCEMVKKIKPDTVGKKLDSEDNEFQDAITAIGEATGKKSPEKTNEVKVADKRKRLLSEDEEKVDEKVSRTDA